MITTDEARSLVLNHTHRTALIEKELHTAYGHCLALDEMAPFDHPFFDHSAMDGYAVRFEELISGKPPLVTGEIPAGTTKIPEMKPGEAIRIFTGAAIPQGADTVIVQEHVTREGDTIHINQLPSKKGQNIRRKGEQIQKDTTALESGTFLDAAAIGFLASIGVHEVTVHERPSVGIIATGSEFNEVGKPLKPGLIFESNGKMLQSALQQNGFSSKVFTCPDNADQLSDLIQTVSEQHDALFVTGGVSVGDYDFTPQALETAGFRSVFHKINQKPGKPLLFAVREGCIAFGMPGNPRSVLSCYHQYALPGLRKMAGNANPELTKIRLPLTEEVKNPGERSVFTYATIQLDGIRPMRGQGSHMLQTCVNADAVIEIPPETSFSPGDKVTVYLLQ